MWPTTVTIKFSHLIERGEKLFWNRETRFCSSSLTSLISTFAECGTYLYQRTMFVVFFFFQEKDKKTITCYLYLNIDVHFILICGTNYNRKLSVLIVKYDLSVASCAIERFNIS